MREMKDSGISWINEIPENWSAEPIKYNYSLIAGATPESTNVDFWDGNIKWITPADFKTKDVFVAGGSRNLTIAGYKSCSTSMLPIGSIVFSKRAPIGTVAITADKLCTNQGCLGLVEKSGRVLNKFYFYVISIYSDVFNLYGSGTTFKEISANVFANIKLPTPPIQEQHRIADFLDAKCAEIDALTADIQTQIDTLEQYKRSVITETVTKGLNPNAEMKDSGIEWVGEIPVHWPVHPVYSYYGERKNKNRLGKEDNLLSLSYGRVIRKDINTNDGLLPESFNTYNIVEAGDIIIRPTDLQNDKRSLRTGLVKEHGIITSAYIDLCPLKQVDSRYFHFLLHAYDVMKVFYNMGNGVRQGLNYSEFSRLMVFEPPYEEQVAMADYLETKVTEVDAIIEQKKEQMAVLDAYKRSLIFEYVTGKKEVI